MNWRAIKAIVRKDLKVVAQNRGVAIPLVVVPMLILIALPGMAALSGRPALRVQIPTAHGKTVRATCTDTQ